MLLPMQKDGGVAVNCRKCGSKSVHSLAMFRCSYATTLRKAATWSLVAIAIFTAACGRRPPAANQANATGVVDGDASTPDPEAVSFATSDGWNLHGDLRLRSTRDGIGVVFIHQLSSNRGEWAAFAQQVAGPRLRPGIQGTISTLAIDLRGHGESTQGPEGTTRWQSFGNDRGQWVGLEQDVAAAVDYLRQRAATTKIILVGSSIGSTAAALFAARRGVSVVSIAMLSPGLTYRGIDLLPPLRTFVQQTPGRVFAAAAGGDNTSADCLDQLERGFANSDAGTTFELVRFAGSSAHGVTMGAQGEHPELWSQLDRWIRSHN